MPKHKPATAEKNAANLSNIICIIKRYTKNPAKNICGIKLLVCKCAGTFNKLKIKFGG